MFAHDLGFVVMYLAVMGLFGMMAFFHAVHAILTLVQAKSPEANRGNRSRKFADPEVGDPE